MKYKIEGDTLPVVICYLENGEKIFTEGGAMSSMSENMKMDTNIGKAKGFFSRLFSKESLFQNVYTAMDGPGMIAFASCFPGSIMAFNIAPGEELILQKHAFLASEGGVDLSAHLTKKLGAGLFGGEGFILQKLSGNGIAFAEFDGHVIEYELTEGQKIIADTGHLAAMSATCDIDIQSVTGVSNMLFGKEGLFNTVITGPGKVWLQTMPIINIANAIYPYLPFGTEQNTTEKSNQ